MKFKESETLELKKSTSELKEGIISIASMLNKRQEGRLYFGIKNDGTVVGQQVGKNTVRTISQAISNHIEPKIYPRIECMAIEGKECILVEFKGTSIPYYAHGRVYMRTGDEDNPLSPGEIEKIIVEKNREMLYWDNQPSSAGLELVNEKALKEFVERGNLAGRLDFKYSDLKTTLKKLGLFVNGELLRAAEVLFCDENPLEVQTAIFAGKDKTTFLDINLLRGNLFHVLKESELYVKNHIRWSVKFGKLEREEIPEVPINAIREALVNSLCHRDYNNPKGNEVAIFKDRIEIYNPGQFPQEYEPEDFIRGEERSILRNPIIANTLYLRKDIERWGSGIKRIHDACREENVDVEFKKLKSGFLVVFHRKEIDETTPQVTPQAKAGFKENFRENFSVKFSVKGKQLDRMVEMIIRLTFGRYLIVSDLATEFKVSVRTIHEDLRRLGRWDIIKFEGAPKTGKYILTEMGKKMMEGVSDGL